MPQPRLRQSCLVLPNDIRLIPIATQYVRGLAEVAGFSEKKIFEIEVAVEEAVSNVIQHAFASTDEAEFSITCEQQSPGFTITIKDQGIPFDPNSIPVFAPDNDDIAVPTQGLGWFLMNKYMDEVVFNNLGLEGKELQLTKYLGQQTLKESSGDIQLIDPSQNPPQKFPPKSVPFTIRKAVPDDAIAIARCAYDVYGYTYSNEHIYYPDRLRDMLASGLLESFVAETKDDKKEIMAHGGLLFEEREEKMGELAMFFTRGKYQGQGCGKKIGWALYKNAFLIGVRGLRASFTTTHIFSQKPAIDGGGKDCCLLIGYLPAWREFKQFEGQKSRFTYIASYKSLRVASLVKIALKKKTVYAPAHHYDIIESIYSNINEKVKVVTPTANQLDLPEVEPEIKVTTRPLVLTVKIELKTYGKGVVQQLEKIVTRLCIDKFEYFYLYLNIEDPLTAQMVPAFETLGFFFAGIMPGYKSGDKLTLQYLNNILIDYDNIQIYSDFGNKLLAYVKDHDPLRQAV